MQGDRKGKICPSCDHHISCCINRRVIHSQVNKHGDKLRELLGPGMAQMITLHYTEPKSKGGILRGRGGATRSAHSVPGPRGGERKVLIARVRDSTRGVQFDAIHDDMSIGVQLNAIHDGDGMSIRERELLASVLRKRGQDKDEDSSDNSDAASDHSTQAASDSDSDSSRSSSDNTDAASRDENDMEEGMEGEAYSCDSYEARSVHEALEDLHDFTDESGDCTSNWVLQVTLVLASP